MKKHILLLSVALLVFACGEKGSETDQKKARLTELRTEQQKIASEIKKLETELGASIKDTNERIKLVRATSVEPKTFRHFISVQGTIDSDNNILVSPKVGGVITSVSVNEGDQVRKGQVMAIIDDAVMRQGIEELKTGLDLATITYQKQKSLWDQKIGSEIQYLQAKNAKESLESKLATLNSQLAMTRIVAPISGTVDEVNIKPGEAANPGMGVIRVVNLSQIKVKARVADSYISALKKGDQVQVKLPDLGKEINGKVSFVGQVVNPQSRTFDIEVYLDNKDLQLKPNMLAVVNINDKTKSNAVVVDENLVQQTEVGSAVFVADGQKAQMRKVKTGLAYNGTVEVVEGLNPGDKLITTGYQDLVDGQTIKIN
jgi:RND family efflux transporter MFP subunit